MAIGTTFYRRLAGNTLKKATGLNITDGILASDYSHIDIPGAATKSEDVLIIVPSHPMNVQEKLFVEINPALYNHGIIQFPRIIEEREVVAALLHTDAPESVVDDLDWVFRIYVARS